MDFQTAMSIFQQLEQQRLSGQIDMNTYRQQLAQVRVVDQTGHTWMIQEQTGQWFAWDGSQWQPGTPTVPAAQENTTVGGYATGSQTNQANVAQAAYAAGHHRAGAATEQTMPFQQAQAHPSTSVGDGFTTSGGTPSPNTYAAQPAYPQQAASQPAYAAQAAHVAGSAPGYAQPSAPVTAFRPGCATVTFRVFLWTLLWAAIAWAVDSWIRITPWWAYVLVGIGALATLVLTVRKLTRHGRQTRNLAQGGSR